MLAFWILASLLTLLVTLSIVWPLLRTGSTAAVAGDRSTFDREVFRAQLRELAQDAERGAIAPGDALAARAEIGRRLIRSDRAADPVTPGGRSAVIAALGVALLLPAGTFLLYDRLGSPEVADQPLASRDLSADRPSVAAVVALIERRLAARPDDAEGWSVVAPVYLRLGDTTKAAMAFREAIRLGRDTSAMQVGLGEALMRGNGDTLTPEARAAFARALQLEPGQPAVRFFLALDLANTGQWAEARAAFEALLRDAPADAPWRAATQAALQDLGGEGSAPALQPGPNAADLDAAAALSPTERAAMVEGMVAQLASRLEAAPDDAEGWARLLRSYAVLGRPADAEAALGRALLVFPDGSPARMTVLRAAADLGLAAVPDARTP